VKVNDAATMDRILADDFVLVLRDGSVQSKADLLKEANSGRIQYGHQEELEQTVRVWGDTAVVTAKLWGKAPTAASRSNGRCGSATRTCARPVGGDTCWAKPRCRYPKRNRMRVTEFRDLSPM
jgi:Domain of unknown function (DUF4440)